MAQDVFFMDSKSCWEAGLFRSKFSVSVVLDTLLLDSVLLCLFQGAAVRSLKCFGFSN